MGILGVLKKGREQAKKEQAKQEKAKQKEAAEIPLYRHIPTHAATDALLSAPCASASDKSRIREENARRETRSSNRNEMAWPRHISMNPSVHSLGGRAYSPSRLSPVGDDPSDDIRRPKGKEVVAASNAELSSRLEKRTPLQSAEKSKSSHDTRKTSLVDEGETFKNMAQQHKNYHLYSSGRPRGSTWHSNNQTTTISGPSTSGDLALAHQTPRQHVRMSSNAINDSSLNASVAFIPSLGLASIVNPAVLRARRLSDLGSSVPPRKPLMGTTRGGHATQKSSSSTSSSLRSSSPLGRPESSVSSSSPPCSNPHSFSRLEKIQSRPCDPGEEEKPMEQPKKQQQQQQPAAALQMSDSKSSSSSSSYSSDQALEMKAMPVDYEKSKKSRLSRGGEKEAKKQKVSVWRTSFRPVAAGA